MGVFLVFICLLATALLLIAEWRENAQLRWVTKPLASAGFIAFALHCGALESAYGKILLAGLVLCALGDVLLIKRQERLFLAGMGAFGAGHLAYGIAFTLQTPSIKAGVLIAMIAMAIAVGIVLKALWNHLGAMRVPVVSYMAIISIMVVMSVAATPADRPYHLVRIAGAAGFAISDIAVARDQFLQRKFINRAWGLPLYFGSQLLLASSV